MTRFARYSSACRRSLVDAEALRAAAGQCGMTMSELVRRRITAHAVTCRTDQETANSINRLGRMRAKVVTLMRSTRGKRFRPLLRYILRADAKAALPPRIRGRMPKRLLRSWTALCANAAVVVGSLAIRSITRGCQLDGSRATDGRAGTVKGERLRHHGSRV